MIIPFGKFKNTELSELPHQYRKWLIDNYICTGKLGRELDKIGYDPKIVEKENNEWKENNKEQYEVLAEFQKADKKFSSKNRLTHISEFFQQDILTQFFENIKEKHGIDEYSDDNSFEYEPRSCWDNEDC